jgi:hypothetical protein
MTIGFQNCSTSNVPGKAAASPETVSSATCMFDGQSVAENASITAYQNSSVPFGSTCSSEERTCANGALSGSFAFASCAEDAPAACLFNGQTIEHGTGATAYQNSSVAFGEQCVSETRSCADGVLSGSYSYASCAADAPLACLFNGMTIDHSNVVTAFADSMVPFGSSCSQEDRTCSNGSLSGSYQYASCNVGAPASCLFDGQTIAHGQTVWTFQNSTVPFGSSCAQEQRTCDDGSLSGSYQYASCSVDAPASCLFNGQTIAHGENLVSFESSTVPFGSTCSEEIRTCNDGTLSGSYSYASCTVDAPANCLFDGQTIAHGEGVTAWKNATSPPACVSQTRTCSDGVLSGAFQFSSCQ